MSSAGTSGVTPLQRFAVGLASLAVLGGSAGWLGLSYLGVVSRDVRVTADVVSLGDTLAPGAKVRYDGLVVGRVQAVDLDDDGPVVTLLIDPDHADAIPSDATARVLPNTAFGSEYVELVGNPTSAVDGTRLEAATHLEADTSEETLQLMASFSEAQKLLAAIDSEALSRATGDLAAALDGRGERLGEFVERADQLVTAVNDDAPLIYGTLSDAAAAADVLAGLLPAAADAAEHARTTAATVVERENDLATLVDSSGELVAAGDVFVVNHTPALVSLLATTDGPLRILADHPTELQSILAGAPSVLHNGGSSIDESSIQMNGLIGLDPLDPYTALDCPRYGTLAGGNCGGPVPVAQQPAAPADPATVDAVTELLRSLDGSATPTPGPTATAGPASGKPDSPEPGADSAPATRSPLEQLLAALLGGGAA